MKGYTRKVGLRQPPEPMTIDEYVAIFRDYLRSPPEVRLADMLDQIRRESSGTDLVDMECGAVDPSACATHGRTSVRRLNEQALAREAYDASCPHCPCTQTTECCYCDGTRTPLEDS